MSKGPGLFSDIGKKAKDLLTRDYTYDQKLSISTTSESGVKMSCTLVYKCHEDLMELCEILGVLPACYPIRTFPTIDLSLQWMPLLKLDHQVALTKGILDTCHFSTGITSAAVKKGQLYAFDVGTQYKYKNTVVDVKIDTDSNISTTFTVSEVLPSTKAIASLKFPDYNAGKVEVQYFHDHASFATVVALKQTPVVDLSATIGAHGVAFGAEAGFDTASGAFTKYNAGIGLTKPDYNASVILADKGDTLRASYVYHLDEKQKSAAVAEITRRFSTNENTFTVGGAYAVDPLTTVKSRLNNSGKLGALLQHELKPKSVLTISGEFDTKALDRNPKFGLALALKP